MALRWAALQLRVPDEICQNAVDSAFTRAKTLFRSYCLKNRKPTPEVWPRYQINVQSQWHAKKVFPIKLFRQLNREGWTAVATRNRVQPEIKIYQKGIQHEKKYFPILRMNLSHWDLVLGFWTHFNRSKEKGWICWKFHNIVFGFEKFWPQCPKISHDYQ